ncbi:MAG: SDR family NAD(P)-dependent oxidoreductase [Pseudomonadota bacterium]
MGKGVALIIGASGGIGSAVADLVERGGRFSAVMRASRKPRNEADLQVDITNQQSVAALADTVAKQSEPLRLVFDATGYLHGDKGGPERSWSAMEPEALAHQFAINAIGPALLMKHLLPLLSDTEKAVFATLSAKVGSISDNRLGGWYGYRAAKAALNQLVRTAAIELARKNPHAICLALHPGTVETPLSAPFAKSGVRLQTPVQSAAAMLGVIDGASVELTGQLVTYDGHIVPF